MSENRRIPLIPFGADKGDLPSASGKQKTAPRTVRITLVLPDSNQQDIFPVFNYKEELAAIKKREKLKGNNANVGDRSGANESDPFDDADDDVRRIAQEMENKYGGVPSQKKKRKGRRDDYADIGMGYDESDSFIDNTDGYDEMIPQNVTTLHGGFYINSGELEFKADDDASSDVSSSSSSSSGEDEEDEAPAKRPNTKRILESSESEGEKETDNEKGASKKINPSKKLKTVMNGEASQKDRKLVVPDKIKQLQPHKKDENRKKDLLLREKREEINNIIGANDINKAMDVGEKDAMKENKKPTGQVNSIDVPESPMVVDNGNKILENETRKEHVNSNKDVIPVTNSINRDTEIVPSSEGENSVDSCLVEQHQHEKSEVVQLPEQLPSSILELIEKLKAMAANSSDSAKLFTSPVNTLLLSLERKCRCLGKQSKSKIYQHLGVAMKCRKETLAKRAKNLVLVEDNKRISDMILQLKANIEVTMPPLLEIYDKECAKILQKKKENENESEKQIRMPKRKFTWSEDMKKLLRDVISTKKRCFMLEGKRPMAMTKETLEAQMLSFLRTDIQVLWPEGWMSMTALTKLYNQFTKSPGSGGDVKVNSVVSRDNLKPVCLNKELQKLAQPSSTKDLKRSVSEKEVLGAKEMQKLASNSMLSIIPVDAAKMLADKTKERKNELTINKIDQPLPIEKLGGSGLSITPAVITTTKTKQQSKTDSDAKAKAEQTMKIIKPPTDHKIENIIKPSPPKTPDAESLTTSSKSSKPENLSKHKNEQQSSKSFAEALFKSLKTELKSETKSKSNDQKNSSTSSSYARSKTNEHSEAKPENLSRSKTLENDIIILEDTMMEPERPKNPEMKMIDLTAESSGELKRKPGPKSKTKYYDQTTKVKAAKSSSSSEQSKAYAGVNTSELDNIIASGRKEIEMLHSKKKQQHNNSKEKSHNEDAAFEEVMEHLKHLNQISTPPVKTESSLTSSPVSVIAFNKNFSTKTSPMSAGASSSSSSTNTATPSSSANNVLPDHIKPDFGEGFQKQFYNFNSAGNATSSKNYNSGHPTLNSHPDKYYSSGNYNYTQNSKYKNYTTPAAGAYNIMDDMLANFITEYAACPKTTANHKPKPPSQK